MTALRSLQEMLIISAAWRSQWSFLPLDIELILQQLSIVGYQAGGGKEAGRSSRPANSRILPQFLILWQLPEENSNQG